uniref:Uncharacterized protein n=1 Tax=Arundo donax TaxID=35708 RepID=A0A0A9EF66_ARUDO
MIVAPLYRLQLRASFPPLACQGGPAK